MTVKPRICILDISNRTTLFEGKMTQEMFEKAQTPCECVQFHPPSNQWPSTTTNPSLQDVVKTITSKFDGLVITGSHDCCFDETRNYHSLLKQVVSELLKVDFPMLGICFGAQFIAMVVYGRDAVSTMKQLGYKPEVGVREVTIIGKDVIFENCPQKFYTTVSHHDCFSHKDIQSLAVTKQWHYHAFRVKDKKCWGIQFHPEITGDEARDLFKRAKEIGIQVEHEVDEMPDMKVGSIIANNFLKQLSK